jgi:predicted TIM-barrel enzyme
MKRLFAVIHVESQEQAVRNAVIAHNAGCSGVFLISHGRMSAIELLRCVPPCRQEIPYVGVNLLDLSTVSAVSAAMMYQVGAVWTDGTFSDPRPSNIEVFSGFAFKYRPQPRDLAAEAVEAAQHCHVLTTSGPGTGKPADVAKVQAIRAAVGDHRIALASGVTADNVWDYLPYVDDYLVASGINATWSDLDMDKARELAAIIHSSV